MRSLISTAVRSAPGNSAQRWPSQLAPPPGDDVVGLTLRHLLGRPAYEATRLRGSASFDAVTGAQARMDADTSVAVPRRAWSEWTPVRRVQLLRAGRGSRKSKGY